MATVETYRVLKQVKVGCDVHNRIEHRSLGHYAPEWMNLPFATQARLLRQRMVEKVTVEEEELEKFQELHEELWGAGTESSELEEVSEEPEEETTEENEDPEPEEIVEEDIDLGPVEQDETVEEEPKKISRRRPPRRTRSKA
ncbi:hypothetical protein GCM10010423_65250 [Streptomyces levis]|uniref:Uncharacterized protein n=1 Tax=Streptomyces levis TaxID=285566 RepID=A0ABN3P1U1_9ACTN